MILNEHRLQRWNRSQETSSKHSVNYDLNIFLYIAIMERFLLCFPIFVCNIRNKKFQVYFHVLMFAPDNCFEIKLLSVVYYYQSRINILMYVSSEKNRGFQFKTEATLER